MPFNGNCCAKSSVQHSSGCRPWWCGCSGPPGPVSRIRHGGSWHPSATPVTNLRHQQCCPCMAPVLPILSVSVHALCVTFCRIGAGSTPVCSVHFWPHLTDRKPWSVTTPLRRQHTGVRLLSASAVRELSTSICECTAAVASWMRSNRLQLNADKTEVFWCTTGWLPQRHTDDRWYSYFRVVIRPWPQNAYWRWSGDEDACSETVSLCFAVLHQMRQIRRSVPQPMFQSLVVTGKFMTRVQQRRLDRPPGLSYASVVDAAARLIFNLRRSNRVWRPRQPSLAACSTTVSHRTLAHSPILPTFQVAKGFAVPAATASFSLRFTIPLLAAEHFRLLTLRYGTAWHQR